MRFPIRILLASLLIGVSGCASTDRDVERMQVRGAPKRAVGPGFRELKRVRTRIEEKIRPYDWMHAQTDAGRHLALFFDIDRGQYVVSKTRAENRPGPLPFEVPGPDDLTIITRDREGKEIGRYTREEPPGKQWCGRSEPAPGAGGRPPRTVEFLLPYDRRIATVQFVVRGVAQEQVDVGRVVQDAEYVGVSFR